MQRAIIDVTDANALATFKARTKLTVQTVNRVLDVGAEHDGKTPAEKHAHRVYALAHALAHECNIGGGGNTAAELEAAFGLCRAIQQADFTD